MKLMLYWLLHRRFILVLNLLLAMFFGVLWLIGSSDPSQGRQIPGPVISPLITVIIIGWNLKSKLLSGIVLFGFSLSFALIYPLIFLSMIQVPELPLGPFALMTTVFFVVPLLTSMRIVFDWPKAKGNFLNSRRQLL